MNARANTPPLVELFGTAATILTGETAAEGPSLDLLARLEYLDGADDAAPHRVALLRAAARFQRIFSLPSVVAPGLVALGAEVDAVCLGMRDAPTGGVSGTGLNFRQAFESCVGEGAEYISQFATADDPIVSTTPEQALANATPGVRALWDRLRPHRRDPDAPRTDWTPAANLADGKPSYLPADLCFRRSAELRAIDPPWPLSTGCGAGTDSLDATLHGLLELIERDAVALWLRGGLRPRLVQPGPGATLLDQLRGEVTKRRTWLLDISTDIGVPVVAAVACDDNGFGLCRGSACRPTLAAAADSALMELAQMELGCRLSATKRAVRGDAALNDGDRQHIYRFTAIDVAATAALHPAAPPTPSHDLLTYDKIGLLAVLRERLAAVGLEVYALNLSRPALGIPVTRAIGPGLEMGLASPPGPRLHRAAEFSGADVSRSIAI
jgi:ribosomal protein S12 methylthiotransferase accessory factor